MQLFTFLLLKFMGNKIKSFVFYLVTCSTGKEIFEEVNIEKLIAATNCSMVEIKSEGISAEQLDMMHSFTGSYEKLFSRRALKYKEWDLKNQQLTEADYAAYIIKEYTFLKRPVVIIDNSIFIGNDKKNVAALKATIEALH